LLLDASPTEFGPGEPVTLVVKDMGTGTF